MRNTYYIYSSLVLHLFVCIGLYVAPPVDKEEKQFLDKLHTIDEKKISKKKARNKEFIRYFHSVLNELGKDPDFTKKLKGVERDKMGAAALEYFKDVDENVHRNLHRIKKKEVLYQQELLAQKKTYMKDKKAVPWNPIHMENKDTFEREDLKLIVDRFQRILDAKREREQDFKEYEMEKEHRRLQKEKKKKKKTKKSKDAKEEGKQEEVAKEEPKKEDHPKKDHERIHEPGHEEQLKEVWEKQDGLDPESFNEKTFFNLHDKNADGSLDHGELQTLFINDVEKVYNESDPNFDQKEKDEELLRMTEHAMKLFDTNKDSAISYEEFMAASKSDVYKEDKEWQAVPDTTQYTPEEMDEYERDRAQRIKDGDSDEEEEEDEDENDHEDGENHEGKEDQEGKENHEGKEDHEEGSEKDDKEEKEGKEKTE